MIDGFIMRDPGSYEDIIDIMEDEQVITPEMADPLKQVIGLRKMIVREFTKVDANTIEKVLNAQWMNFLRSQTKSVTILNMNLVQYLHFYQRIRSMKKYKAICLDLDGLLRGIEPIPEAVYFHCKYAKQRNRILIL